MNETLNFAPKYVFIKSDWLKVGSLEALVGGMTNINKANSEN